MLRNSVCVVKAFLFVFASSLAQQNINSGLMNGDECTFNETIRGVCTKIDKCDYITENPEFRKQIPVEIKRTLCLSRERIQLVCCPFLLVPSNMELDTRLESKFESATCVKKEPRYVLTQNIEGGDTAGVDEFPFQATIGYIRGSGVKSEYSYLCGGSLIAKDIVITSAKCLRIRGWKLAVVRIGATSLIEDKDDYSEWEDIKIYDSVPHKNYSSKTGDHNIGLIKLARPYNETSLSTTPICLSTSDNDLPFNFTITGYHLSKAENRSNWLLKASANIHPRSDLIQIKGYNGAETCFGDNGGPLIHERQFVGAGSITYLYGIKSHGSKCGTPQPNIYTKVNSYITWIQETIELLDKNSNNNDGPVVFA